MSKTPRTDKNRVRFSTLCHPEDAWWVHETVSAQLEHELNAANERIKRLEEAGDEMYKFINPPSPCMRTSRMDNLLQGWDDAKINIK